MVLLGFLFFICLFFSPIVKNGIKNGLILLTDQVIPALYPFVLITTYIKKKYASLNSLLLIGISILSGYPVGAKIIAEHSFLDIPITKQNLLILCNNPSLPYLISYVGAFCLNNPRYGLIIYLCIVIGNILTLVFKNLFVYLFIFWLCWVFIAVCGLSLVAVHLGFSLRWLLLLWCTGLATLRHAESSQTRD